MFRQVVSWSQALACDMALHAIQKEVPAQSIFQNANISPSDEDPAIFS